MVHTIQQTGISAEMRQSLSAYLANRDGSRLVTMSEAIVHVRNAFPQMRASDTRLTDTIVGQAIILGLNLELDRGQHRTTRLDRWAKTSG
jgi:hypothetical protein